MIELFHKANFDWMGKRRIFIAISVVLLLSGLASAFIREFSAKGADIRQWDGSHAFNLGVDFKGGTVLTVKFRERPSEDDIRAALQKAGVSDAIIQASTDKRDEALIKIPLLAVTEEQTSEEQKAQVDAGRARVKQALDTFGKEAATDLQAEPDSAYKIVGTDSVGPVAGRQLRNQGVAVTLLSLLGILFFIAFRYDWTYAAGAVIAVFHDVLVTLAMFSIFQWEISLTVIAALLTLVGFSVNDSIVIFDRVRENEKLHRRESLYNLINTSINQTLSRTVITSGLVLLSVAALVVFGGEVLFGFSIALFIGVIYGTYSTIAIASPIALWWEQLLGSGTPRHTESVPTFASSAKRGGVVRQTKTDNLSKAARS